MPRGNGSSKMVGRKMINKGAWTPEEDERLSQYIELHGANRWKTVALKAGLDRCGKSCRLRWLNYLRPNIVRGNISDAEEDLILRLHKLLGNRWSLIAGRLPGRTDNEIKNYWNSHLSKKLNYHKGKKLENGTQTSTLEGKTPSSPNLQQTSESNTASQVEMNENSISNETNTSFDMDGLFDSFSMEEIYGIDWVSKFLEVDGYPWLADPLSF